MSWDESGIEAHCHPHSWWTVTLFLLASAVVMIALAMDEPLKGWIPR